MKTTMDGCYARYQAELAEVRRQRAEFCATAGGNEATRYNLITYQEAQHAAWKAFGQDVASHWDAIVEEERLSWPDSRDALEHERRAASHAALEESDGLYPDEMIALGEGRGFVMWDGTGAIRALPGHYARYEGITTRTSSCEHTRPFSYRVCRECAAEFVRRATDS